MAALPNWLFSVYFFLVAVFAVVSENLFVLLILFLSVETLIDNLIFVLEWSNVDKSKISNTYQHINCICNFDATWISFRKILTTFISKNTSYLMKSVLNEKFIFFRILSNMILMINDSGAIVSLLNMAKWSIIWIILWIWPHIIILLNMSTKMLFVFMTKGFKITFVFKKFDDSLL